MLGTAEQRERRQRSGMPLHTRGGSAGDIGEAGRSRTTGPFHVELPVAAGAMGASHWDWVGHWDFWVAMVVGAFLRLWHLDLSTFLADQRITFLLARDASAAGQPAAATGSLPGGMTIAVSESTEQLDTSWLGPLHLLSGHVVSQAPQELHPTLGAVAYSWGRSQSQYPVGAKNRAPSLA